MQQIFVYLSMSFTPSRSETTEAMDPLSSKLWGIVPSFLCEPLTSNSPRTVKPVCGWFWREWFRSFTSVCECGAFTCVSNRSPGWTAAWPLSKTAQTMQTLNLIRVILNNWRHGGRRDPQRPNTFISAAKFKHRLTPCCLCWTTEELQVWADFEGWRLVPLA